MIIRLPSMTMKLTLVLAALVLPGDRVTAKQETRQPQRSAVETIRWESMQFELQSGEEVAAQQGELSVPEMRKDADSRRITLRFVKFASRSKQPGAPIVYLAGGPGGSGTAAAKGKRWAMFDRLRDISDVIVLDQRGTGLSEGLPAWSRQPFETKPCRTEGQYRDNLTQELKLAAQFWNSEGADYRGYTTRESAADIEALRVGLRAERLNLLGISYGTHLALAFVQQFPNRVDRLVLVSAEGLDQTVKLPARTDAYFQRLQAAIDQNPKSAEKYPDIVELMKRVQQKVENDGDLNQPSRFDVQRVSGYMIADPSRVAPLLNAYQSADRGNFGFFKWLSQRPIRIRGMPELMDIASGISASRLAEIEQQSERSLLGKALNFPMPQLREAMPGLDLGDAFRVDPSSDRPALFFSGTLDGRTYPESHREIASGFKNHAIVTVKNGGHNLFFDHDSIVPMIAEFFGGKSIESTTLEAKLPSFAGD